MSIIKREPFGDVRRFFDDFSIASLKNIGWDLALDVYEEKDSIVVKMNLPGIESDKLHVSVEGNFLRVWGDRDEEKEEKNKQYYSKEIKRGSFERVVSLPQAIQINKISAEYKQGVLKVVLPKENDESPSQKIEVKVKMGE